MNQPTKQQYREQYNIQSPPTTDTYEEITEARIFNSQKKFMAQLLKKYPEDYRNESEVIRAALTVFQRWIKEKKEHK